ncbi:hypothetical protein [Gordonia sp. (in: high G+C Gram-positive bacteria)]|uniref:hypothetical protein n=1 Tax=Gordonia sp. (in: high G+C Gram-positive bacteria) TaxID=84139 RepID=UPI0016958825|nr:hypothetical protein [Gordonia sp. (in: high G+C Gram-positive bacteria)]NLG45540.1 hypothetical protein [Gordonia sp. (in: high G+C Gram-positive bacteria)]
MTAPGLPIADPSAPPKRPDSIVLAVQLWFGVVVLQIVAMGAQWNVFKADFKNRLEDFSKERNEPELTANLDVTFVIGMVGVAVALTAVAAVLMWFTYVGYTWARLILGWASAFVTVNLAFSLMALFVDAPTDSKLPDPPSWAMIPGILGGVCAVGALAALMHRDSAAFCRDSATHRSRKRQNGFR